MAARVRNRLTALQAARLRAPGRHADGGGLYLSIDGGGRRRWVFLNTRRGKRVELGLGGGRDMTLAAARAEAEETRRVLAAGGDPKALRRAAKAVPSFGEMADALIAAMRPSWRNAKHPRQWEMTLAVHAAALRPLPVDEVGTDEVLGVLEPLWRRTPETAERLRGRIEAVLSAARARGFRAGPNPASWRGHLDQLLPKRQRLTRGHHAALPFAEVPGFMAQLRGRPGTAARALEMTILTAARTGEVLGARWGEVDLERALWTVPAARMKAGREHRVPLAPRLVEILAAAGPGPDEAFLFPGPKPGRPLSTMAMAMLLRRMKAGVTVHGFRSSFRDWAAETTAFPHEVCEMALAHTIGSKAEAAYRRGDLFDKRRALMQAWAAYCDGAVAEAAEAGDAGGVAPAAEDETTTSRLRQLG